MNGNQSVLLEWGFLTLLAIVLMVFFGYLYRRDKDKRKLMFMLAFAFASLSFLPSMEPFSNLTNGLKNLIRQ